MLLISMLILANVISFIGQASFTSSSLFKKKRVIISLQSINHLLCSLAMLIQKAFSGMVQDAVQLLKNIVLLFVPDKKVKTKITISVVTIIVGIVLGILFNIFLSGNPWYGYLPVIATATYSTIVLVSFQVQMRQENCALVIKFGLLLNCTLWGIYALLIKNYVILSFNTLIIIMSIISIITILVSKAKSKKEE